jgi:hypothetical protein
LISQANVDAVKTVRPILALSLLFVALVISGLFALVGTGGLFIFGVGQSLTDTYYLMTPVLLPLILLTALLSVRLMAALLLIQLGVSWIVGAISNWPSINPIHSGADLWQLDIVLLACIGYFLFMKEQRRSGVVQIFRGL